MSLVKYLKANLQNQLLLEENEDVSVCKKDYLHKPDGKPQTLKRFHGCVERSCAEHGKDQKHDGCGFYRYEGGQRQTFIAYR